MNGRALYLVLMLAVVAAALAGHLVWGDAPLLLADDIIVWGN